MIGSWIERILTATFGPLVFWLIGLIPLLELVILGVVMLDILRTLLSQVAGLLNRKKPRSGTPPIEGVWPPAPKPPGTA